MHVLSSTTESHSGWSVVVIAPFYIVSELSQVAVHVYLPELDGRTSVHTGAHMTLHPHLQKQQIL